MEKHPMPPTYKRIDPVPRICWNCAHSVLNGGPHSTYLPTCSKHGAKWIALGEGTCDDWKDIGDD